MNNDLLQFEPIQQFLKTVGADAERYFGKDATAIVYLRPDGAYYGAGLFEWLTTKRNKRNIVLLSMDDDGNDLDEEKVKGKKVLLVDNDIVTGKGYKRSMEAMRVRKSRLGIKDIKFATFFDRVGLADFSVEKYSAEAIWNIKDIDALDLKIIKVLAQNGRAPLSFIAQKTHLSSVSVKNRINRLLKEKVLRIQGTLSIDQFYTLSAHVEIEADEKTVQQLIEKLEQHPEVYHIAKKVSGTYNLLVGVLARSLEGVEEFVKHEIRGVPGVKHMDIFLGEIPVLPRTIAPAFSSD